MQFPTNHVFALSCVLTLTTFGVMSCESTRAANQESIGIGIASQFICVPDTCGDGNVDVGEGCDDGNVVNDDGCSNTCRVESCGDGVLQTGEMCDDGNVVDDDGCSSSCLVEAGYACSTNATTFAVPRCGNGAVDVDEACDDGNLAEDDACRNDCTLAACGDGIRWHNPSPYPGWVEQCDDGNTVAGDGCSPQCVLETCGNGIMDAGEACDPEIDPTCPATCESAKCPSGCNPGLCGSNIVCSSEGVSCDGSPLAECVGNCLWWTTCTAIANYPDPSVSGAARLAECVHACKLLAD